MIQILILNNKKVFWNWIDFLRADTIRKETFKQDILLLVYSKKEQISFPVPPVPLSHHTISLHRACLKAQQAYHMEARIYNLSGLGGQLDCVCTKSVHSPWPLPNGEETKYHQAPDDIKRACSKYFMILFYWQYYV